MSSASISQFLLGVAKPLQEEKKDKSSLHLGSGFSHCACWTVPILSGPSKTYLGLDMICQLIGNIPCLSSSPQKCLLPKELTKLESFLTPPHFHYSFFLFPLLQPFLSTISPPSIQPFQWPHIKWQNLSYFAGLFILTEDEVLLLPFYSLNSWNQDLH